MYDMSSGLVFRPLLYNYDIFRTLICKISYLNRPYFIPMTFSEIYALWKEEKARTLKKASYSTYVLTVDSYILPMLADKEDITEEDKDAVFEHILSQGLKPLTAQAAAGILCNILRYGASMGLCEYPTWTANKGKRRASKEVHVLSTEQQAAIIDFIDKDRTPGNIIIYLALTTGISVGELRALCWQDIDFKARKLHIRNRASYFYEIDATEGGRKWNSTHMEESQPRDIPLSKQQLEFLRPEKDIHLPELYVASNSATPMDARVIRNRVNSIFKQLGIKGFQFKALRHSFAVRCLEEGCDIVTLGALLGTASYEVLAARYAPYIKPQPAKFMELAMGRIHEKAVTASSLR